MKNLIIMTALVAGASACGGSELDYAEADETAESSSDLRIIEASGAWIPAYRSSRTNNLSSWRSLDCNAGATERVLYGLRGRRERSSNADNFVAGLDARCRTYIPADGLYGPSTVRSYVELFDSTNTRSPRAITVPTENNRVAIGLRVNLNSSRRYIRNIDIVHTRLSSAGNHGSRQFTSGVTTLSGNRNSTYVCPRPSNGPDQIMTGIRLRHNQSNGKIRQVDIRCTPVGLP